MKSLLISIKPKYVAKILNGEKTIEVRKKFPKDYKGWVYIYCTKSSLKVSGKHGYKNNLEMMKTDLSNGTTESTILNGKVVARFYCDKVEEIVGDGSIRLKNGKIMSYYCIEYKMLPRDLVDNACLTFEELSLYLHKAGKGYAIHISNLEIFDRPKELGEFYTGKLKVFDRTKQEKPTPILKICSNYCNPKNPVPTRCGCRERLTKAPQNYMFIEVEE